MSGSDPSDPRSVRSSGSGRTQRAAGRTPHARTSAAARDDRTCARANSPGCRHTRDGGIRVSGRAGERVGRHRPAIGEPVIEQQLEHDERRIARRTVRARRAPIAVNDAEEHALSFVVRVARNADEAVALTDAEEEPVEQFGPQHQSGEFPLAAQTLARHVDVRQHEERLGAGTPAQRVGQLHEAVADAAERRHAALHSDEPVVHHGVEAGIEGLRGLVGFHSSRKMPVAHQSCK